jgi:hypothetical protein
MSAMRAFMIDTSIRYFSESQRDLAQVRLQPWKLLSSYEKLGTNTASSEKVVASEERYSSAIYTPPS